MDFATLADFALKAGVPSALGVFIVWYLLSRFIPSQQALFRSELEASRNTFKDALASEQKVHSEMLTRIVDTVSDEAQQTRASLDRLNTTTQNLTEVVHKMSGKVSVIHQSQSDGVRATAR